MTGAPEPLVNRLLAALPAGEFRRLRADLERVDWALGESPYGADGVQPHVYFPAGAVVSLMCVLGDGGSAEAAMVGYEGVVGVVLPGQAGGASSVRTVVHAPGVAYRLERGVFVREFAQAGPFQKLVLGFLQALVVQMVQTAGCMRHHTVDEQLCRWLLQMRDRLRADELRMTQESIAGMLGVRREGVTEAAGKLQAAGLIHYVRGRIRIVDRAGLEQRACECYGSVRAQYARLLGDGRAP